jgi:hypothetical protein
LYSKHNLISELVGLLVGSCKDDWTLLTAGEYTGDESEHHSIDLRTWVEFSHHPRCVIPGPEIDQLIVVPSIFMSISIRNFTALPHKINFTTRRLSGEVSFLTSLLNWRGG